MEITDIPTTPSTTEVIETWNSKNLQNSKNLKNSKNPQSNNDELEQEDFSSKRRSPIPRECRLRIFQLWSLYQQCNPIKPSKKGAGKVIAMVINNEYP